MRRAEPALPQALEGNRPLAAGQSFSFTCHPGVPCFNACCADVNIFLTPLDILLLARTLGLHTREFLDRHTINPITRELQLPVVMLKMRDEPAKRCPFLAERGCGVYEQRPWACRMYPLGMALPPARAGEPPKPVFFVLEDDHCQGRSQGEAAQWTADAWRRDQQVCARDELESGFRELVSHPWFIGGRRQLDPRRVELFHLACYDLDSFRSFVFDSSFRRRFVLEEELESRLATDDQALLRFAFRWLRFALFGEPTLTLRKPAAAGGPA
jgi:Fe-S-cluster containining protein